jgi:RimJ/RimL family protein N-acetyltransferase
MPILTTPRLRLIALSPAQLEQYLDRPAALERELSLPLSRDILTERVARAIRIKLRKMAGADPSRFCWYTYWLVAVTAEPFGAGLAGFKGYPDEEGKTEIGYGIDPRVRGKGYTTEAVRRLIAWAFEEPACQCVFALNVDRSNLASQRVLAKAGMSMYHESANALSMRVFRPSAENSPSG